MESIYTHILTGDARMEEFEPRIQEAVDVVLPQAVEALGAHHVDIIIGIDPRRVIPEIGVGGSTQTSHVTYVWIDPNHENVHTRIEQAVQSAVVHELHHAMRNRTHPWPGTLLNDMVGEGLADHFDMEITGSEPPPWAHALSDELLEEMYARAKLIFDEKGNGHPNWMFGSEEENIPRWTGYALGFYMVKEYVKKTGKNASELVDTPAEEFVLG